MSTDKVYLHRLLAFNAGKLPCCHLSEGDDLIISGTVISCQPPVAVKNLSVTVATVYPVDTPIESEDSQSAKMCRLFKVWCDDNDPQLPHDGDNRLWFDWSAADLMVAVVVKSPKTIRL